MTLCGGYMGLAGQPPGGEGENVTKSSKSRSFRYAEEEVKENDSESAATDNVVNTKVSIKRLTRKMKSSLRNKNASKEIYYPRYVIKQR
ncbi:hypothetical protein NQ318_012888 [Aromia moschata]|uniref:Uncharacterized protein n=1 Tax=Aromia moschata TaxID=1265417 RepID=A0AAV8YDS9_9CUCU|nr:hypothetical protein NQ318_012888 [Aromia moschata]